MSKFNYIYSDPDMGTSAKGDTPYAIYDNDLSFVSESVQVAKFVARKLGHPVMQIEMNSSSIYACFEESTSDYSLYINQHNMKNWMFNQYGNSTRLSGSEWGNAGSASHSMGTGSVEPQKPNMGSAVFLSEQYGEAVNVGGSSTLYSGSIILSASQQTYDLPNVAVLESSLGNNDRMEIQRLFNDGSAAITKFYDPFAGTYDQQTMLNSFGMGNVSPSVSFVLRPINWDITRAMAIETNDRVRKSNYSFEIQNNRIRLFPVPNSNDAGNKIYFHYYKKSDRTATTADHLRGKVSDPSNVPYKFITYQEVNAHGRQWIRRYTLALAKELLGIIRSKYASMPLPNGEVTMDGEALKAEGREEQVQLTDELKEFLESVSLSEQARLEQETAESQQQVLNKAPLQIYIG